MDGSQEDVLRWLTAQLKEAKAAIGDKDSTINSLSTSVNKLNRELAEANQAKKRLEDDLELAKMELDELKGKQSPKVSPDLMRELSSLGYGASGKTA